MHRIIIASLQWRAVSQQQRLLMFYIHKVQMAKLCIVLSLHLYNESALSQQRGLLLMFYIYKVQMAKLCIVLSSHLYNERVVSQQQGFCWQKGIVWTRCQHASLLHYETWCITHTGFATQCPAKPTLVANFRKCRKVLRECTLAVVLPDTILDSYQ